MYLYYSFFWRTVEPYDIITATIIFSDVYISDDISIFTAVSDELNHSVLARFPSALVSLKYSSTFSQQP